MESGSNVIEYLRDCYFSDSSGQDLLNIFSRSIENKIFLKGKPDLEFDGNIQIKLPKKEGTKAFESSIHYEMEKELIFSCVFLAGKIEFTSESIASPLVIFSAKIEIISDVPFLNFDVSDFRINYGLIKKIISDDSQASELHEKLHCLVAKNIFKSGNTAVFVGLINEYLRKIDTAEMVFFPNLMEQDILKKEKNNNGLKLLPLGCVSLIKRSLERRGIIDELSKMSSGIKLSKPVQELLQVESVVPEEAVCNASLEKIPAVLSDPQYKIMESCSRNTITLVIGPPGSGKSFTIACMALEHIPRGKSVLIASRKNHAVDVIEEKIESLCGDKKIVVRGGRKKYLAELKKNLQNILSGIGVGNIPSNQNKININDLKKLSKLINSFEKKLLNYERQFESQSFLEKKYASIHKAIQNNGSIIGKLRHSFYKWRVYRRSDTLFDLLKLINESINNINKNVVNRLKMRRALKIDSILSSDRKTLRDFLKSIRARTATKQKDILSKLDISVILKTFPVWLTNNSDIHDNMPLMEGMFDLVIIDESTQCDIASCLPVIQRGKKVAIVGDPNQLRHVSFLSRSKQELLGHKSRLTPQQIDILDYRSKSILDLAEELIKDQNSVQFLDEHYRSEPDIIEFSNRMFYNSSLRIMKQKPELIKTRNISILECKGPQSKNGINESECLKIIDLLKEHLLLQSKLDSGYAHSIGIVTPFRNQSDYLMELVMSEIPIEKVKKHNLLIGTPHSFQGEERDIIFISLVLDRNSHPTSYRYLNQVDVFNVMITRARLKQIILHSIDVKNLKNDSVLAAYFSYLNSYYNESDNGDLSDLPESALPVYESLNKKGYKIWTSYTVAGLDLDFVINKNNKILGIDLIGFPGRFQDAFSLERYKMMNRAELLIFPLGYSEWIKSPEDALVKIQSALNLS